MGIKCMNYLMDGIIVYIFCYNFFRAKKEEINSKIVVFSYVCMELLTWGFNCLFHGTMANLVISVVSVGLITLLYQSTWTMRLAGTILFQIIACISEVFSYGILEVTGQLLEERYEELGLFIAKIILFLCILLIQIIQRRENEIPKRYVIAYLLIPSLSLFILGGIYYTPVHNDVYMYVFAFAVIMINFISYYLLNVLAIYVANEGSKQQLKVQMQLQQEKYTQLIQSFQRGNRIIHDFNKHITYLHSCLETGALEDAQRYLETMNESLKENYYDIRSGNLVVDALLNNAKGRLHQLECELDIQVDIVSHEIQIHDFDLVTILGNVLDNMIHAVQDEDNFKCAKIHIFQKEHKLIIYTMNQYHAHSEMDHQSLFHGTGLQTVNEVLGKYGGMVNRFVEDDMYHVMVIIPMVDKYENE